MRRMTSATCRALLSVATIVSCGGSEPSPQAPAAEAPVTQAARPKPKQRLSISGQLGSLDQGKVEETFNRLMPKFGDCLSQGASRVEFIGGPLAFFLRIALHAA